MLSTEALRVIEHKVIEALDDQSPAVRARAAKAAALFPASAAVRDALLERLTLPSHATNKRDFLTALIPWLCDDISRRMVLDRVSPMAPSWVESSLLSCEGIEPFLRALSGHASDPQVRRLLCKWVDAAAIGHYSAQAQGILIVELLSRFFYEDVRDHWFNFEGNKSAGPIQDAIHQALEARVRSEDEGLRDYLRWQILQAPKGEKRILAMRLLKWSTWIPSIREAIAQALKDPEPRVAAVAAELLLNYLGSDETACSGVLELANFGPEEARRAALAVLGRRPHIPGACEAIFRAAESPLWYLREAAVQAMAQALMEHSAEKSAAEREETHA